MKTNRTYETRIYFVSKNPKIALANAEHLVDINCKNKNFRYRYNRIVKESRERFAKSLINIDPMYPVIYKVSRNVVEGEKSRKLYNVREDGVYYCISVLHFVENPKDNDGKFYYHRVEAVANLKGISDDEFLEYVESNKN